MPMLPLTPHPTPANSLLSPAPNRAASAKSQRASQLLDRLASPTSPSADRSFRDSLISRQSAQPASIAARVSAKLAEPPAASALAQPDSHNPQTLSSDSLQDSPVESPDDSDQLQSDAPNASDSGREPISASSTDAQSAASASNPTDPAALHPPLSPDNSSTPSHLASASSIAIRIPTIEALVPRTADRVIEAQLQRVGWARQLLNSPLSFSAALPRSNRSSLNASAPQSIPRSDQNPDPSSAPTSRAAKRASAPSQPPTDAPQFAHNQPQTQSAPSTHASALIQDPSDLSIQSPNASKRSVAADPPAAQPSPDISPTNSSAQTAPTKSTQRPIQHSPAKPADPLAPLTKFAARIPLADASSRADARFHKPAADSRAASRSPAHNSPFEAQVRSLSAQALRGVAAALSTQNQSVTLNLEPASLGQLQVKIELSQGAVNARFIASSAEARKLLDHSSSQLRRALEARGLIVETIDVRLAQPASKAEPADATSPGTGDHPPSNAEAFNPNSQDGSGFTNHPQGDGDRQGLHHPALSRSLRPPTESAKDSLLPSADDPNPAPSSPLLLIDAIA